MISKMRRYNQLSNILPFQKLLVLRIVPSEIECKLRFRQFAPEISGMVEPREKPHLDCCSENPAYVCSDDRCLRMGNDDQSARSRDLDAEASGRVRIPF